MGDDTPFVPRGHARQHRTARRAHRTALEAHEAATRVAVMMADRNRRNIAALLALPPRHHRRLREIHHAFKQAMVGIALESTASFLLHYFCCEATAKVLISAHGRDKQASRRLLAPKISTVGITAAVGRFGIGLDHALIMSVYGDRRTKGRATPPRRVRDDIAHEFDAAAIGEVNARSAELFEAMRTVITRTGAPVGIPASFYPFA